MESKQIERINELARKAKTEEGLTVEEKDEQAKLRQDYIKAVRANLRGQLDNIDIEEDDGTVVNLGEKFGDKKKD